MKERPILFSTPMVQAIMEGRKTMTRRICKQQKLLFSGGLATKFIRIGDKKIFKCPYGQIGDHLWVKETFFTFYNPQINKDSRYYKADFNYQEIRRKPWTPSIFMPRSLSRITLKITNIRVEKLQDISEQDAINEGIDIQYDSNDPVLSFYSLWESINGKGSWDANPWVWVIKFKRL